MPLPIALGFSPHCWSFYASAHRPRLFSSLLEFLCLCPSPSAFLITAGVFMPLPIVLGFSPHFWSFYASAHRFGFSPHCWSFYAAAFCVLINFFFVPGVFFCSSSVCFELCLACARVRTAELLFGQGIERVIQLKCIHIDFQ